MRDPSDTPDCSEGDLNTSQERRRFAADHVGPVAAELLSRDERVFVRQSLSTPCMNALVGAEGSHLIDSDGRRILDFHGNSVHQIGHRHPRVVAAIRDQLDTLAFCPRRYTCEPAVALAERLLALAPSPLSDGKVLFAPGGALAIGIALKLARAATGRHKVVSFDGAFHGASLDAASVSGERLFHDGMGPLLPGVIRVPPPARTLCSSGCVARGGCDATCADEIIRVLECEGDIGVVLAEPVRCTTVTPPSRDYWRRVRAACDRSGALLVFDEIPTAMGRTGRFFCLEHFGVCPDMLVLGKGLGGGIMPLAAVLARRELDVAPHLSLGHYTHEKPPIAAAAALAALDIIASEGLVDRAATVGERWMQDLRRDLQGPTSFNEVRGLGLLVGVELRRTGESHAEAAVRSERVLSACLRSGLSFKVSGGNVLTLTPPLNIAEKDLESAGEILVREITGS